MNSDATDINWSDLIVIFNSLIRSIETLWEVIETGSLDEGDLYDAEEELNNYVVLLARLRQKYSEIDDKGELSEELSVKLRNIC